MNILNVFSGMLLQIFSSPLLIVILIGSTFLGIIFGAMPGLTATLGVALLTTLTYGLDSETALLALLAIYVGGVYGGMYTAILLNIPGTAASAATAMDGYPMAHKGQAGRAFGLATTSSLIGSLVGMTFVALLSPLIAQVALQFTSYEYFLLALFGILISGSLTSPELAIKGWIAGLFGIWLSTIGQDHIQMYPRFTFGMHDLDNGIDVVPVLIGAFGIPQIMIVLESKMKLGSMNAKSLGKLLPDFRTMFQNLRNIITSAFTGVGIGAVPGIGEDIAAWVSYGIARKTSKTPEEFGKGAPEGVISTCVANQACVGGAMIPLLSLGIPGSPPAVMLLGALMLHNVAPGPMLLKSNPDFVPQVTAILFAAGIAMWICGMILSKQVIHILRVPQTLFMPLIAVLCVIGSFALGLHVFNLYLMGIIGIISYFFIKLHLPIAPLVIGVILGPMADTALRTGLKTTGGSLWPMVDRPISLVLVLIIVAIVCSQIPFINTAIRKIFSRVKNKLAGAY
ncbi:tripartite tricarboxylate transporter permease [Pseudovibrio exalbescens]|uniref:Transporter n=1 Tax=Pseudovibrio exalbescens TaxID=197461 RepID=A0A1U7JDV1_9HYPH|nr:tripartite tricarboxylate transporter permease [Pseudovibrio exalbescens]OKL42897.1 transporter [Pseudovibrio exalbescens]